MCYSLPLAIDSLALGKISDVVSVVLCPELEQSGVILVGGGRAHRAVTPFGVCNFSVVVTVRHSKKFATIKYGTLIHKLREEKF
jgi:hypothetical protein